MAIQTSDQSSLLRVPDFDGSIIRGGCDATGRNQLNVGKEWCVTSNCEPVDWNVTNSQWQVCTLWLTFTDSTIYFPLHKVCRHQYFLWQIWFYPSQRIKEIPRFRGQLFPDFDIHVPRSGNKEISMHLDHGYTALVPLQYLGFGNGSTFPGCSQFHFANHQWLVVERRG